MSLLVQHPYLKTVRSIAKRKKVDIFIVGGLLRDQFIGRSGCDIDFAVSSDAISTARAFARAIKGAFVLLDEEHPCGRVVKKEKGQLYTFDFADFRAKTIAQDLSLRDFTVNALCLNLKDIDDEKWSTKIIDQQGSLNDLKNKTVRMVAARAFKDDPLRLMRAFTLFAQYGFKIEAKTLAQMKKDVTLISRVSMERIREEWFKVLASVRTVETIKLMQRVGLLDRVMPQLGVMRGVHQGGYHHLDVWEHTLEVVRQFELVTVEIKDEFIKAYLQEEIAGGHKRYALIKFACLLHDIGKPQTKKEEEKGRMSFHSHEHVGAGIARHVAKQLKLSVKERYFLEDAVRWHLRPGYLSNFKKPSERMIFRYLRDTKEEALSVLLLALADQRATCGKLTTADKTEHHRQTCWIVIKRFIDAKNKKPLERLLTGTDLIKKLKLKPSPLFAKILSEVQEAQALGKIATAQDALKLAKQMALKDKKE